MRHFRKLVATTALALSLGTAGAATPPDTLVMGWWIDDLISLDPAEIFEFSGAEIAGNTYERLVNYDYKDVSYPLPLLQLRASFALTDQSDDNTGNMIHDWEKMIEYASTAWTLEPGDVVATGTCSGVALGVKPPRWLKVGDVVRMEVDGIGYLENRVVPEPPGTMGFIG